MPSIDFTIEEQQEDLWCWAAVSVSVDKSLPPRQSTMDQCDLAANVLRAGGCCGNSRPAPCNSEATLRAGLIAVGRPPGPVTGPLAFSDVNAQLTAGKPVCIVIEWQDPSQPLHFAVISRAFTQRSAKTVIVRDPDTPAIRRAMDYEKFKTQFSYRGSGKWISSYML
jgi:hypothetical protein